MNTILTQTGTLPIGIIVDGVRHQEFDLRAPTVGDNIDAAMEAGSGNTLEVQTAVYARQMTKLGTLPSEKINLVLLRQFNPMDWNAVERADGELQKKLISDGQPLIGGSPVAPSLPVTE